MKTINKSFQLPTPWDNSPVYAIGDVGALNYLVGPNGSGKSRFAYQLHGALCGFATEAKVRLLSTDRLTGFSQSDPYGFITSRINEGYAKPQFENYKDASRSQGLALDTFVILAQKPALRIKIEALLSQVLNRQISLEWEAGFLIPKARLGALGGTYRLDQNECHGVKELLVLLTHIYDTDTKYLIIDEPELNLHPQF